MSSITVRHLIRPSLYPRYVILSSSSFPLALAFSPSVSAFNSGHQRRYFAAEPKRYPRVKAKRDDGTYELLYRADRVLANRTGKSRNECTKLLKERRIFLVEKDDEFRVLSGPSEKISMQAELRIDKKEVIDKLPPLLMVYHKPKWILSVRHDPLHRPILTVLPKMHPVGRLDYDTSGLLLFSSSGPITQALLHPKYEVTKEYVAVVKGNVDMFQLGRQLDEGVKTGEGVHTATLLSADTFDSSNVKPFLKEIEANLPPEYNKTELKLRGFFDLLESDQLSTVRLVVTEGKYRMVRRMLANCGHPVVSLKRERLGEIFLGDLPEGCYRELAPNELAWAESLLPEKAGSVQNAKKSKL